MNFASKQSGIIRRAGIVPGLDIGLTVTVAAITGPGTSNPTNDKQQWTYIKTADADAGSGTIAHLMGTTGQIPEFEIAWTAGSTSAAAAQLSLSYFSVRTITQWAILSATTSGS